MLEGFFDSFFGHFMIGDALDLFCGDDATNLFVSEKLFQMPCNSFAFAVGVSCDQYFVSFLCGMADLFDDDLFLWHYFIMRNKAAVYIDSFFVRLRQIAHVTDRSEHAKITSQIFGNCLCF